MSIKTRLLGAISIPVVISVYFIINSIQQNIQKKNSYQEILVLSELAPKISDLVHELQKERGMSAGFLGSKGTKFVQELPNQQSQVDNRLAIVKEHLDKNAVTGLNNNFDQTLSVNIELIKELQTSFRSKIMSQQVSISEQVAFITRINEGLLSSIGIMSQKSPDSFTSNQISAYVAFLNSKERAGIERAVLTSTFAKGKFDLNTYSKFNRLVTLQDVYLDGFRKQASSELLDIFNKRYNHPSIGKVEEARKHARLVNVTGAKFEYAPESFFATITEKINVLKDIENTLGKEINDHVSEQLNEVTTVLNVLYTVALFCVGFMIFGVFFNVNVVKPITEIKQKLEGVSRGNLDSYIEQDLTGEFNELKTSMNTSLDNLNAMLGTVRYAADNMAKGAAQVSDTSMSISQGATEQAASLEEITASMNEMASQTKQNAENANQANKLAQTAQEGAEHGNAMMGNMMQAMDDIDSSAQKISKIIKVIDEIAFQTNLLALNAAVEAARAGVHGKGFAVVAEEVRNLAARSANAARETTTLIEGAIKDVNTGSEVAQSTSKSLNEIVVGIYKVTDLVGEIAASSSEQALGIGQVNEGLVQLDQVTQQNAASSEESAAASRDLTKQSVELTDTLSRFVLKETIQKSVTENVIKVPAEILPKKTNMQQSENSIFENTGTDNISGDPNNIIPLDDTGRY